MFTERLRDDLRVEVWRYSAINLYYDDVLSNARKTLAALEGSAPLSNEGLLIAAYRATQYAEYVQYRAAAKCGDRSSDIGDYEGIKHPLDYECMTGLTQQEIDSAAASLRSDPTLVALLRLRIANINSAVSTQVMSKDVLTRLNALSRDKP